MNVVENFRKDADHLIKRLGTMDVLLTRLDAMFPDKFSYSFAGEGFVFTFDKHGDKVAHKIAKELGLKFQKTFDKDRGNFSYVSSYEGIEINIWSVIPSHCKIVVEETKQVTKTEYKYRADCRPEKEVV